MKFLVFRSTVLAKCNFRVSSLNVSHVTMIADVCANLSFQERNWGRKFKQRFVARFKL